MLFHLLYVVALRVPAVRAGSATDPLAEARRARRECFHIRHDAFLAGEAAADDIANAIRKVGRHAERLVRARQPLP